MTLINLLKGEAGVFIICPISVDKHERNTEPGGINKIWKMLDSQAKKQATIPKHSR